MELAAWHDVVRTRDPAALDVLLDDDVVFHSPVVHTPQRGKAITRLYLMGAMQVLGTEHFRYLREISGTHDALLEFVTEIDGLVINGVDLIRCNDAGKIVDFKVMVRPLEAVDAVRRSTTSVTAPSRPRCRSGRATLAHEAILSRLHEDHPHGSLRS